MEPIPAQKEIRDSILWRMTEIGNEAQATGKPIGAILVDIDDFKWGINDAYGHQFGDQVLLEVAARLSTIARPDDVVTRFQSDEFVVVPAALRSLDDLQSRAKQILRLFDVPIVHGAISVNVEVSIGVAMQESGAEPMMLLYQADEACYQSKRNGRGRASLHGSDWEAT